VRVFFISLRRRPSVIYRFVNRRLGPSLEVVRRFKSLPGGRLCDLVDLDFFSPARRPGERIAGDYAGYPFDDDS